MTGQYDIASDVSVDTDLLYSNRDFLDASSGFGGYQLERTGAVEAYGGTLHLKYKHSDKWGLGLYTAYSRLEQALTTRIPVQDSSQNEPGDSSLREISMTLNAALGNVVQTAAGAGIRREKLTVAHSLYGGSYAPLARTDRDAYAEVRLPLGSASSTLGELELNAAMRYDSYSGLGSAKNPKAGLAWSPLSGLKLRASFATSLRPPTLDQLARIPVYYTLDIMDSASRTGTLDTLVDQSQGNTLLRPEKARTATAGVDFHPEAVPGIATSLSWVRSLIRDRIAAPLIGSPTLVSNIFERPSLANYVSDVVDPERINAIFNGPGFVADYAGHGPSAVAAIFNDSLTNVAEALNEAVEASVYATYAPVTGYLVTNYILRDSYKPAPGAAAVTLVNNVGQAPNLRARGGLSFSADPWGAAVNVNYTNGYHDSLVTPGQPVRSFTAVDLQLEYRIPLPGPEVIKLTADARNVFNTAPPSVPVPAQTLYRNVGFDASNAVPFRRVLSLQISASL